MALRVALTLAVALVLADSSIVVLALPEIYRDLGTSVTGATWVLISYNLVLAAVAVPAAAAARRSAPALACGMGLLVFAGASLGCGLAGDLSTLIAFRCLQAVGGAAAVTAALELLPTVFAENGRGTLASVAGVGAERRAALAWAGAGAAGAALGPATGGLLTELLSWQSIFLFQVPLALLATVPLLRPPRVSGNGGVAAAPGAASSARPHLAANLALAAISAALAAALFLIVLLMIEGWRLSPISAAAAVSVMPLAALGGSRLAGLVPSPRARAAGGTILISGGLAGLGLLPDATIALTVPPQILIGVGLSLVLSALTETALEGRSPQAIHGGWTLASRHAGVVVGLLALTPVFTADLSQARLHLVDAGTAVVLDADAPPALKLELAERIDARLDDEEGRVPVVAPAFDPAPEDSSDREASDRLESALEDQVDRAATHAFSASFLIAAAIGLSALLPIVLGRRVEL